MSLLKVTGPGRGPLQFTDQSKDKLLILPPTVSLKAMKENLCLPFKDAPSSIHSTIHPFFHIITYLKLHSVTG